MLQFRPAQTTDITKLNQLVNSAYRGDSSKLGWTTEADLLDGQRTDPETLRETIQNPEVLLLVGEENGEIICCSSLTFQGNSALLGMITTNPALQGKGLGKKIIAENEKIAKSKGILTITMTVISVRTEIIEFYKRRGYLPTGQTKPFPYGNVKFGLPKRNDLEFIVLEKKTITLGFRRYQKHLEFLCSTYNFA